MKLTNSLKTTMLAVVIVAPFFNPQSAHAGYMDDYFSNGMTIKIVTPANLNVNLPSPTNGGMINTFEPDNTHDWKFTVVRSSADGIKFKRIGTNHLITAKNFPSYNLSLLEAWQDVGGEDKFQTWVAIPTKPGFFALCLKAQRDQCMNVPNSTNRTKLTTYKFDPNDRDQMFSVGILGNISQPAPPPVNVNANTPFLPFDPGVTLPVTQGYGGSVPNGSHATLYPDYNRYALDFGTAGKRVGARAVRAGQVVYAGWKNGGYGNVVVVKYRDGKFGRYLHLAEVWVRPGDQVAGGQGLGLTGKTGNADGPHLHYAESNSDFGPCVQLPEFADARGANFNTYNFNVTSKNPDGRR